MPVTYINDPPAYFKVSGYDYVAYTTRTSIAFSGSAVQWALVLGIHDNNNGVLKGSKFAIGTTKRYWRTFTLQGGWTSWTSA